MAAQGHEGRLRGRTFSAPRKWEKGKGRKTIQFGCCYNYAVDREGREKGTPLARSLRASGASKLRPSGDLIYQGLPEHSHPITVPIQFYSISIP